MRPWHTLAPGHDSKGVRYVTVYYHVTEIDIFLRAGGGQRLPQLGDSALLRQRSKGKHGSATADQYPAE